MEGPFLGVLRIRIGVCWAPFWEGDRGLPHLGCLLAGCFHFNLLGRRLSRTTAPL